MATDKAPAGRWLYAALRPWVRTGAYFFFRRITISGEHHFPGKAPVILVANHQNAMMDPVLCCLFLPRQLHWLTRADVFRHPMVGRLLRSFNMLPVYRERDKVGDLAGKNDETFRECYRRLSSDAVIAMFPEGTHRGRKQLHLPLKKGLARLALGALDSGLPMGDLCIVPVGIDYGDFYSYRRDLHLEVGAPIHVKAYAEMYPGDQPRMIVALMAEVHRRLSSVMIDIPHDDIYDDLMAIRPLITAHVRPRTPGGTFRVFRSLCEAVASDGDFRIRLGAAAAEYRSLIDHYGVQEDEEEDASNTAWMYFFSPLILLVGWPLAVISMLVYGPVYLFTERFVRNKVKDPLFVNSIRLSFWTFLTPVWLAVLTTAGLLAGFGGLIVFTCLAAVLVSGILSLGWLSVYTRRSRARRLLGLQSSDPEWAQALQNARERLFTVLSERPKSV